MFGCAIANNPTMLCGWNVHTFSKIQSINFQQRIIWKILNPKWEEKLEQPMTKSRTSKLLLLFFFLHTFVTKEKQFNDDDDLGFISISLVSLHFFVM